MTRISKRQVVAGLVVTLGVADGVGIYVAQHRLDKPTDVGPREMAMANEPLAQPIAIRTSGDLKPTLAMTGLAAAPHADPAQATPQTVRFALADPVKAPAPVMAPMAAKAPLAAPEPAVSRTARETTAVVTGRMAAVEKPATARNARQIAPVVTGRMAAAERPAARRLEVRRAAELASKAEHGLDLRVHQQRIPARLTHAERRPYQEDAFTAAFGIQEEAVRLPDPAYGSPDLQPRGQASAELPPLELSTAQIHSEPAGTSDSSAPPAPPPTTAAGAEDLSPKS